MPEDCFRGGTSTGVYLKLLKATPVSPQSPVGSSVWVLLYAQPSMAPGQPINDSNYMKPI